MQVFDKGPVQNTTAPLINNKAQGAPLKEEVPARGDGLEPGTIYDPEQGENEKIKQMKEALQKGVDAVYSGAERTSEYLDSSPKARGIMDTVLQLLKTIKTFPRFIYPSLINMSKEERALVISQLDKLPLKDVGTVKSITMLKSLPNASGGAGPLPASPFILLTRDNFHLSEEWAKMVLTHETGHCVDYNTGLFGLPKLFSESSKTPWGKPPYITSYAATGPGWYPSEWDDFAESYAYYHVKPEELKAKCPEKFARMEQLDKNSFFQQLVDRKEFRETGKFLGNVLEKAPYLQNGLAMVSLVGGLVQAYKALGEMRRGEKTGDEKLKMNATMNFAAGSCFASKLFAVPGMAIEGAKSELNRAIEKKEISAAQANAVVQATVGVIAGPVGHALNWVMGKMPWNKTYEISDETLKNLDCQIPNYKLDMLKGMENKEFTKRELKHLMKKLEFGEGEIVTVNQYLDTPKEPKKGDEVYLITDATMKNLKDKLSEEKLDVLNGAKNDRFTEKEIGKILNKAGFHKGEIALIKAYMVETEKDLEPVDNKDRGSLARAALIGSGGAAGAVSGGFIGPYAGILAGFAIAGPIGGVVGLVAGAIIGLQVGARLGGRIGNLAGKGLEWLTWGKVNQPGEKPAAEQKSATSDTRQNVSEQAVAPGNDNGIEKEQSAA
jgi:hypothetical protein